MSAAGRSRVARASVAFAGRGPLVALALLAGAAGCGGGPSAAKPAPGPSCRAVAIAAERWIADALEPRREGLTRLAVELIDLCQAPGLSATTRKCVAGAASFDAARACPALPLTPALARVRPSAPAEEVDGEEVDLDAEGDMVLEEVEIHDLGVPRGAP